MRLPAPLHVFNEGLAFLLEIAALGCLAWWGWHSTGPVALRLVLAVAAPAAAAVLWGLFAAPKARIRVPLAGILAVKALVFGAAVAALYGVGHPAWGLAFGIVALVNTAVATVDRRAATHH
ncbi:YrdB family protein [Streptomyces sp. NPDC004327]|uniref:YrdB family protein n=1 Tax=unclassified Streptomyces TaxID=2593676 RepID=UPI0036D1E0C2